MISWMLLYKSVPRWYWWAVHLLFTTAYTVLLCFLRLDAFPRANPPLQYEDWDVLNCKQVSVCPFSKNALPLSSLTNRRCSSSPLYVTFIHETTCAGWLDRPWRVRYTHATDWWMCSTRWEESISLLILIEVRVKILPYSSALDNWQSKLRNPPWGPAPQRTPSTSFTQLPVPSIR